MSYIKEAQTQMMQRVRFWHDTLEVLEQFRYLGRRATHEYVGGTDFFVGLSKMMDGCRKELHQAVADAFIFVGVGDSDEILDYSRKMLRASFKDDRAVMQYLDQWCRLPPAYRTSDAEAFRKEVRGSLSGDEETK